MLVGALEIATSGPPPWTRSRGQAAKKNTSQSIIAQLPPTRASVEQRREERSIKKAPAGRRKHGGSSRSLAGITNSRDTARNEDRTDRHTSGNFEARRVLLWQKMPLRRRSGQNVRDICRDQRPFPIRFTHAENAVNVVPPSQCVILCSCAARFVHHRKEGRKEEENKHERHTRRVKQPRASTSSSCIVVSRMIFCCASVGPFLPLTLCSLRVESVSGAPRCIVICRMIFCCASVGPAPHLCTCASFCRKV